MGQSDSKERDQEISEAELRDAFNLFDKDRNGTITVDELHTVMMAFGKHCSHEEIREMINEIDANNDGNIDFEEFKKVMADDAHIKESESDLRDAFRVMTEGKKVEGFSPDDLKKVMEKLGHKLTDREVEALFREVDNDKDGLINFSEFVNMWNATHTHF